MGFLIFRPCFDTGLPKKDARFSKLKNIPDLLSDAKDGRKMENIDFSYFSNRASFMGNPVCQSGFSRPDTSESHTLTSMNSVNITASHATGHNNATTVLQEAKYLHCICPKFY